jgi:REP element-mobilizing transposase RayT
LGNILAAVVMDDHVHVLTSLIPAATGQQVAQTWKSVSSHGLTRDFGRASPVWQRQYFDRWLMDRPRIESCARYVLMNPVRRWPGTNGYRWIIAPSDD